MPVDAATFSEELATLSTEAATALVADLWSARGREVARADTHLLVGSTATASAETLAVVTDPSDTTRATDVDTVVTTVDAGALDLPSHVDVVGPADVFELLTFGVEPDRAERLLAEYFDDLPTELVREGSERRSPTTASRAPEEPAIQEVNEIAAKDAGETDAGAAGDDTVEEVGSTTVDDDGSTTVEDAADSPGTEAADGPAATESPARTPTRRALLLTGGAVVAGFGVAIATGVTTNAQPTVDAPGVTADGVVDAASLGAAHAAGIADRSYSLALDLRISGADERLRSYLAMDLDLAADRTCRTRVSTSGEEAPKFLGEPPATAEFWSDGTTHLVNHEPAATDSFTAFQSPDGFVGTWKYWAWAIPFGGTLGSRPRGYFETVFDAVPTRLVERRETADGPRYRVANDGRELTSPSSLHEPGASDVRDVRLDALIDGRGVVRSFELDFAAELDGERAEFSRRMAYTAFGETTVERPDMDD